MANPFGDYTDEEYAIKSDRQRTSTPSKSVKHLSNSVPLSSNPFGDDDDDDDEIDTSDSIARTGSAAGSHSSCNQDHLLFGSQFRNHDNFAEKNLSASHGSLSLSSGHSETNSVNSGTNVNIGNYSLGDGSLQKEGLLCPHCLEVFKTITELMRHSEECFESKVNDVQSENGTSLVSSADLPGQMSVQIKDFLNKLINKPKQSIGGSGNNINSNKQVMIDSSSVQDSLQCTGLESDQTNEMPDPVRRWKFQMVLG